VSLKIFLKNFFFPPFCVGCFRPGVILCYDCFSKLASPKQLSSESFSFFGYGGLASRLLKKAKYRGFRSIIETLLENLPLIKRLEFWNFLQQNHCQMFCYLPITEADYRVRGYNQAEVIARYLANVYHLGLGSSLIKVRQNQKQSMLKSREERVTNVQGVYRVITSAQIKHKTVALVDDVITTGSTIKEAERMLLERGAKRVLKVSLFRAGFLKR